MTETRETGRFGALPPIAKPRVRFGEFLTGEPLPTPPRLFDDISRIDEWGMLGNDEYGDCAWAGLAHLIQSLVFYASGRRIYFDTDEVLRCYSEQTGFDPNDPSTDQGTILQDALSWMRTHGMRDTDGELHRIVGFAEIDRTDWREVHAAHALFGGAYNGFAVYAFAMQEFEQGRAWREKPAGVRGSQEGGHCVPTMAYRGNNDLTCVTWGQPQVIGPMFWRHYMWESWAVVTQDWLNAQGESPSGFDIAGLLDKVRDLTG